MSAHRRHVVVMVATSYPRFPGDTVGTFMEPIAHGLADRGHQVHMVLPWHPKLTRSGREGEVHFHPFRYAPVPSLNVFGYAGALEADVRLRWAAWMAAPLAMAAGWRAARRVIRETSATIVHGHWVVPGGVIAAHAASTQPIVISLHGSDVYVAERHTVARYAAAGAFARAAWVTACSDDLRERSFALGADRARSETIPYGVDATRFKPDTAARAEWRRRLGLGDSVPVVFTVGRFVRKKGFTYLIEAVARLRDRWPDLVTIVGGSGDLQGELIGLAARRGLESRVMFPGLLSHDDVARYLAAADLAVVPSVRDDDGNVDGLPNVVLEAMASGTPLVTTAAGGIGAVVSADQTALVVAERDAPALADAIERLLRDPSARVRIGAAARQGIVTNRTWTGVAERFESVYNRISR